MQPTFFGGDDKARNQSARMTDWRWDGANVLETGRDLKPHELHVKDATGVPGSGAPVKNLFHVSQALSWIAGTRNTIPERLDYVKAIPRLMEPLTSRFVKARQA